MSDIELLKLAAKAAGIEFEWSIGCGNALHLTATDATAIYWNPLSDDGDAMRLAVKLNLFVVVEGDQEDDSRRRTQAGHRSVGSKSQNHGNDPCAATRRAIVRAAAAIGEQMP